MHASRGHEDHDELVEFLIEQGHSEERAQQIAGNHPDAVRADMHAQSLLAHPQDSADSQAADADPPKS